MSKKEKTIFDKIYDNFFTDDDTVFLRSQANTRLLVCMMDDASFNTTYTEERLSLGRKLNEVRDAEKYMEYFMGGEASRELYLAKSRRFTNSCLRYLDEEDSKYYQEELSRISTSTLKDKSKIDQEIAMKVLMKK